MTLTPLTLKFMEPHRNHSLDRQYEFSENGLMVSGINLPHFKPQIVLRILSTKMSPFTFLVLVAVANSRTPIMSR